MIFQWESQEERLKRFMSIPPLKKMEWLRQMHEFLQKTSSRKTRTVRQLMKRTR